MAITFIGTPLQETFVNTSYFTSVLADPSQPFGSVFQLQVFADNSVNYGFSTEPVFIDLETNPQQFSGYAYGDTLVNIFRIFGTAFNDVIRGSDLFVYTSGTVVNNPGA